MISAVIMRMAPMDRLLWMTMMMPAKTPAMRKTFLEYFQDLLLLSSTRFRTLAAYMTMANLASSEGCSERGPILIHLLAPLVGSKRITATFRISTTKTMSFVNCMVYL